MVGALGIIASAYVAPAAGGGVGLALVDSDINNASGSSYTFSSRDLGAADSSRIIIVSTHTRGSGYTSGVTIAGVTATLISNREATDQVSMWAAAVPTGTTGDIVITQAASVNRMGFIAHRMVGCSITPDSTDNNNSGGAISVTPTSGGVLIAAATYYNGAGEQARYWTNVTESEFILPDGIINGATALDEAPAAAATSIETGWASGVLCGAAFPAV